MTDHYGDERAELMRELDIQKSIAGEFQREEERNAYRREDAPGVVSWTTDPDIGAPYERAELSERWDRTLGHDAYGSAVSKKVVHTRDGVQLR